jgi:hypothetical protein
MRDACSIVKVFIWEYTVQERMQVDQIGSSFATIFTSSTSVNVGAGPGCSDDDRSAFRIAALSRNLFG